MASFSGGGGERDWPEVGEIGVGVWALAEKTAGEVLRCVQPTQESDRSRKEVTEYICCRIRSAVGCELFPYGSVPLKTYLPDGDIDLTALTTPTAVDTLPRDVFAVLQGLENNQYAEYVIKDTQFIDAEVKLVKCLVENILIDLSFNQLGGISTLCFLEQVDNCIGKNHLFKRSIILVKSWCYYESRILGASHGLISTYAMETLVLYIFHLFHSSLDGPLSVLYKFLDYFSKFDWDKYCISLNGPVSKASLPNVVVDVAQIVQNDYLLSEEFLKDCIYKFSVPSRDAARKSQRFSPKYLNIIDPLNKSNNLGRSVSRGNFYRIQGAFRYGARKLGRIFTLPRERIANEIKKFFVNTFQRRGHRNIDLAQSSGSRSLPEEKIHYSSFSLYPESNTGGFFYVDRYYPEINHIPMAPRLQQSMGEMGIPFPLSAGEMYSRPVNYQFDCSASAWSSRGSVFPNYAPRFQSFPEDSGSFIGEQSDNHLWPISVGCYQSDNYDRLRNYGSGFVSRDESASEVLALDFGEDFVDAGRPDNLNRLSDLTGDYCSNMSALLYGMSCHGHPLFAPLLHTFISQFGSEQPWNTAHQSMWTPSSHFIDDRVNLGLATYPAVMSGQMNPALSIEENHNIHRGKGTYIPNDNAFRGRPNRGRYRGPGSNRNYRRSGPPGSNRNYRRSGSKLIEPEKMSSDEGGTSHEQLSKTPSPALHLENNKIPQESNASAFDDSQISDAVSGLQKLEFGSLEKISDGSSLRASDTSSGSGSVPSQVKSAEPSTSGTHERDGNQSYYLKDEDFPPLQSKFRQ